MQDPIHQFQIVELFPVVQIGSFNLHFTNSALFMLLSVALTGLLLLGTTARRELAPNRLQSIAEFSYEFVAKTVRDTAGDDGMKFFPLVFSLFIFILFANVVGLSEGTLPSGMAEGSQDSSRAVVAGGNRTGTRNLQDDARITAGIARDRHACIVRHVLRKYSQTALQPPGQWMKPEQAFDHEVNGHREIVTAPDVTHFVRENRIKLGIGQPLTQASRPHQHGFEHAKHAGLECDGR